MNTPSTNLFSGVRTVVFDLDDTLYAFDGGAAPNADALRALAAVAAPALGVSEDAFLAEVANIPIASLKSLRSLLDHLWKLHHDKMSMATIGYICQKNGVCCRSRT